MNHILMPGKADLKSYNNPARYGINAMEILINSMMKLGANRYKLLAKVFGGAHVLSGISEEYGVGLKNVECIIDFLMNEKIRIANYNIGGYDSRRIFFYTDTEKSCSSG
jgi:chemotaxis protein CheD